MCTVANTSDEFNLYGMSFGLNGKRKFSLFCSLSRNGIAQNEILRLMMQCSCGTIQWEISGQWQKLLGLILIKKDLFEVCSYNLANQVVKEEQYFKDL